MTSPSVINPHFDEGRLVWSDEYAGRYSPPPGEYGSQFDQKWRLVLEDSSSEGFGSGPSRLDDDVIECLVYQWTGRYRGGDLPSADTCPARQLDQTVDVRLVQGKRCIDVGCGAGRWTLVMQRLGAREVLSVDASAHSLESVGRFNPNVLKADVTTLCRDHPELVGQFDFANLWGVAHHTHDPKAAFMNAAATVGAGGAMYLMVYAPEGLHNTPLVNHYRRTFRNLKTVEEQIAYVEAAFDRKWHRGIPFSTNCKNVLRNLLRRPKWGHKINLLDLMMPFYNWTVPLDVAKRWMTEAGFRTVTVLNSTVAGKSSHHLLGSERVG